MMLPTQRLCRELCNAVDIPWLNRRSIFVKPESFFSRAASDALTDHQRGRRGEYESRVGPCSRLLQKAECSRHIDVNKILLGKTSDIGFMQCALVHNGIKPMLAEQGLNRPSVCYAGDYIDVPCRDDVQSHD